MSSKPVSVTQKAQKGERGSSKAKRGQKEVSSELTSIFFGNKNASPGTCIIVIM